MLHMVIRPSLTQICGKCAAICDVEYRGKCSCGTAKTVYWPCKKCGYTVNGVQCELTRDCPEAIQYREINNIP